MAARHSHLHRCRQRKMVRSQAHNMRLLLTLRCCRLWSKVVAGAPRENAPLAPAKAVV